MKPTKMAFHFRKDASGFKRESIEVDNYPELEIDDLLTIMSGDDVKVQELLVAAANDLIYAAARAQVDSNPEFTALDLTKLDLSYIANLPRPTRAGAISKETWEAFKADYISVVCAVTGKDTARVTKAATITADKFASVKHTKPIVSMLTDQLAIWYSNTTQADAFADVFDTLVKRSEAILNAEENLADML